MKSKIKNIFRWGIQVLRTPLTRLRAKNSLTTFGHSPHSVAGRLMRQHWMVALGLAAGIFAFWSTQQYAEDRVAQERERMLPKGGLMEVLVAARDLSAGDPANATTVAVRQVPREWSLPGALSPVDFESINQLTVQRPLPAGSPLTLEHLRSPRAGQSTLMLEPGFRAVSIAVDEVSSVGGLIQPGDRVDLWGYAPTPTSADTGALVTLSTERQPPSRQARLVAENLKVVATGSRTERADERGGGGGSVGSIGPGYTSITLAVPGSVAAYVLGGQFQGRLGIALRAASDGSGKAAGPGVSAPKVQLSQQLVAPVEILIGNMEGASQ